MISNTSSMVTHRNSDVDIDVDVVIADTDNSSINASMNHHHRLPHDRNSEEQSASDNDKPMISSMSCASSIVNEDFNQDATNYCSSSDFTSNQHLQHDHRRHSEIDKLSVLNDNEKNCLVSDNNDGDDDDGDGDDDEKSSSDHGRVHDHDNSNDAGEGSETNRATDRISSKPEDGERVRLLSVEQTLPPHGEGASYLLSLFSPSSSAQQSGHLSNEMLQSTIIASNDGASLFDKFEKPPLKRQITQKRSNTSSSCNSGHVDLVTDVVSDGEGREPKDPVSTSASVFHTESSRLLLQQDQGCPRGVFYTSVNHNMTSQGSEVDDDHDDVAMQKTPLQNKWKRLSRLRSIQQQQQQQRCYPRCNIHKKQNVGGVQNRCMPVKCDIRKETIFSAIVGSFVLLLFHVVFCLAQASTIHRPFSKRPVLGWMTRMAAVGPLIAGPFYIHALHGDFASVYPSLDCFPAPFFAQMAALVDESLVEAGLENDDMMFVTTVCVLSAISLVMTGILILIGTKVKLVNLSAFLPYPVMCGFFTSVGVLMWTLAFTVDTGENVWHVLFGGDMEKMRYCMKHHVGSIIIGSITVWVGKRNQGFVPILTLLPLPIIYIAMYLTGTDLKEAQENGWFWNKDEFVVQVSWSNVHSLKWEPPLPFGVINGVLQGKAYMPAIIAGFPVALSMALIYFIRCSVHAPALRKNSSNLLKWKSEQAELRDGQLLMNSPGRSEHNDQDFYWESIEAETSNKVGADTKNMTMTDVFVSYGKILALNGLSGGFACLPAISVGGTLFKIGAVGPAPQYGSLILLAVFYLTKFGIVGLLPKVIFSSLLFVSSVEMVETWFFTSYRKTAVKSEWAVIPIIVIFTFVVGSLQSVALGLALSTFIFVGTLNKHGIVKFIATGLTVHSITERSAEDAIWLDQNGDLIQILVLQSYIFFGNANSCLSYVNSMFEDFPESIMRKLPFPLPPIPKYLVVDMTLVSGMDTSSVDVFGDIIQLCFKNKCRIYFTGLSPSLKKVLALGGVKPSTDKKSPNSLLRFLPEMESALSQSEDGLLKSMSQLEQKELRRSRIRANSSAEDGFLYALKEIDKQHDLDTLSTLAELKAYTTVVELKAGESLILRGGLYFIEHGMMKVERDPSTMTTRESLRRRHGNDSINGTQGGIGNVLSLSRLNCRTPSLGKECYLLKSAGGFRVVRERKTLRIARLKPGFVIGVLGGVVTSHNVHDGDHVAVTPCRLWHLSQKHIKELEEKNPRLILELFKTMALLSAQRQEATIDQLTTLHQIMTSLAPSKPMNRLTMAAIRNVS